MSDPAPKPAVAAADVTARSLRRRSVWKWVVRVVLGVLALLLLAYATLPYWLPTGWLARHFENQLSASLNRQVRIGTIRVGWRSGISVENVTIADTGGPSDALLARIGRIRCGLTPLFTIWSGRVDRLEVVDPEIWLTFDEDGHLISLTDLGHGSTGGRFPTWDFRFHRALCHLQMPDLTQTFRVDDLVCGIDKPAGTLTVSGQTVILRDDPDLSPGESGTARLRVEGSVVAPQLRKDVLLHGQGRVEWQGLAVTDLPLLVAMRIPIEQVDGVTSGRLGFSVHPELRADYDLSIRFHSVRVLRRDSKLPWQVPDANLSCKGSWDPVRDLLTMDELDYQTQALRVHGAGTPQRPALLVDPAGDTSLALHAAGRVHDWAALCREFPEVAEWSRSSLVQIEGGADLSLDYSRHFDEDRLAAVVEGRRLKCAFGLAPEDLWRLDPEVPKRLTLDVSHNRSTGLYHHKELSLVIGGTTVACRGEIAVPAAGPPDRWDRLRAVFPTLRCELVARTADVGELARLLPTTGGREPLLAGQGPAELRCSIVPQEGRSRLALSLDLPPGTRVEVGPGVFVKPADRPVSVSAAVGLPHPLAGELDGVVLDVGSGAARMHVVSQEAQAHLHAAFPRGTPGGLPDAREDNTPSPVIEAAWKVPLKVRKIEDLAALFPRLVAAMRSGRPGLSGDADLAIEGRLVSGGGDWLVRNELALNAEGLAVRWPELVEKPAARPMNLRLAHQCQSTHGRWEQSMFASLNQDDGDLSASLVFSEGRQEDAADDLEAVTLRAALSDVDRFAATWPLLRRLPGCRHPEGSALLEYRSLLAGGRRNAVLRLDATEASFIVPGSQPFNKPAGTPARLQVEWERDPIADDVGDERWHVTSGSAQLGGLMVTELTGMALAGPDRSDARVSTGARGPIERPRLPSRIKALVLRADGHVVLDDPLWQQHPTLRGLRERLAASGDVTYSLQAGIEDDLFSLKGRLDAQATGLAGNFSQPFATFVKSSGTPATIGFDLSVLPFRESGRVSVEARQVELDIAGNRFRGDGQITLRADGGGTWCPAEFAVDAEVRLANPAAIGDLVKGCPFELLDGEAFVRVSAAGDPRQIQTISGEAGFDGLRVAAGSEPIGLDGRIEFDQERIVLDQVRGSWGDSRGTVAGVIRGEVGGRPNHARLGMVIQRFDQPQLADLIRKLPLSPPAQSRPENSASEVKRAIVKLLRNLDMDLDLRVDRATVTLPMQVRVDADAAVNRVTVKDGYVNMSFGAVAEGGSVTGSFMTDLARPEPTIYLNYTASRIQPGPLVDQYLALTFPGMKATGPLTLIDETRQKLLAAPGEPNYEVGDGELIIEGGSVAGRAAPIWMTSVFPGLNLASFEFSYMHSWFKKTDDGRIRHQMIFQGRFYNIYMVGESQPGGRMQYEVGIDFFADFDSRYWAESGQGRIPLFTKTGRVAPGGELADEQVEYVPQQLIMSLLVKNNPVVTAYHAVRKRVRGEQ